MKVRVLTLGLLACALTSVSGQSLSLAKPTILAEFGPILASPSGPLSEILILLGIGALALNLVRLARKKTRGLTAKVSRRARPTPPRAEVTLRATLADGVEDRHQVIIPRAASTPATAGPCLDTIGWDNFELLVAELFRRQGYAVEITSGLGADGGKDVVLRKGDDVEIVQCKNLARGNRVTAGQMRDFFGVITAEGAKRGYFVTTGHFSADAKTFSVGKPIELIERADVERLIAEASTPGENLCDVPAWINLFAANVRVVDPLCPSCQQPMKLRRGALGRPFWGCPRYASHRCFGKRDCREELQRVRHWQPS